MSVDFEIGAPLLLHRYGVFPSNVIVTRVGVLLSLDGNKYSEKTEVNVIAHVEKETVYKAQHFLNLRSAQLKWLSSASTPSCLT